MNYFTGLFGSGFSGLGERIVNESVPVIAIDGPSGVGKGAVSRLLAARLGWGLLDSGALYRLLALDAVSKGIALDDESALFALGCRLDCEFPRLENGECILLNGREVTREIRSEACGNNASKLAALPGARKALLQRQRDFRVPPGLVADGRDMGTDVFPDAYAKIFLTATPRERAVRRHKQLKEQGTDVNLALLLTEISERDKRDRERLASPLRPAIDAVLIDTTDLDIDTVLSRVMDVATEGSRGGGGGYYLTLGMQTHEPRNMTESFAELFEQSEIEKKMRPGAILYGTVIDVLPEWVIVNAGLKSESMIPIDQFANEAGDLEVEVGDRIEVALDAVEDGFGTTRLSREKAKRARAWLRLEEAYDKLESVTGIINDKVKGGFTVDLDEVRAFLPGSLVDVRPVRDTSYLEGKPLEFKVIKLDRRRNNVVVSRRAVVEEESSAEREDLLSKLEEGAALQGIVKNLTDYGAFVDLGGIDGLLHITDMAWKRVKHPSEIVSVGDEITVKVLKFDQERNRVSLGLKQLGEDPWLNIANRYPVGARTSGIVTNIADYGCFAEIEDGVEGLVHVSEMDWTNKNVHPTKVVQVGDEVEVMVLDVDEERRRISLGIKQCKSNPWEEFAATHKKGDRVAGKIKSITDFGIFIGLDGGIDGLVHLSDISWSKSGDESIRDYRKGEEVETVVLSVDAERERISLGVKQLDKDPFSAFLSEHPKGSVVLGVVQEIDAKGAIVRLSEGVEGHIRASDLSRERVSDARQVLDVGDEVEAKIVSLDRKKRTVLLSIKAKESEEEAAAVQQYSSFTDAGTATLGDIWKKKMDESQ
uniref:Cytidylate kinase n=1 Tax=Candidatus Kentrum sp. UNK TaxID=2126344 RepID=A0A451AWX8_9GAMM|nr:MAG: cytidylate kinase/ribosomal protein S1,TIGR00717 [Candidatus Kentron sp. UNK]VFK70538.1 MAG: cytidylate kinase/ribosomal protein S1,TIGR00717 [Candidatus Kentron sp. UNK]